MTDQPSAFAAVSLRRQIPPFTFVACIAALSIIGTATAQAKQPCSVAAAAQGYWSWRMIDGKKCWYEGKPMLSKTSLEWPAQEAAQPDSKAELANAPSGKHGDPMDAQAYAPDASKTFDALWRERIETPGRR
jgi:hypothetical protein